MKFTRNDYLIFMASLALLIGGFICIGIDPDENGFGILTLWVSPIILIIGFMAPVVAIIGTNQITFSKIRLLTLKHLAGCAVFVVALVTYLITLEPTASLWDCSEFIASAFKLQVPHTPGTPLSLLIARVFAMFAGNDLKQVAYYINIMSALFSALTVYLVYFIILFFGKRLTSTINNTTLIIGAVGGSLCLTFSDTFWYSAVEAETYGLACFFLMLLIFLIVDGIALAGVQRSRRLILIFYISGLAYCIHPMCVLALPVLPFAWQSSNNKINFWNACLTVFAGMLLVLGINRLIAIGSFEAAFAFDFYFVNTLGTAFYAGAIFLLLVVSTGCYIVMNKYPITRPYLWAFIFMMVGFTPYATLFVRSAHNPPIDETNPENLAMIKAYMNRESYPTSPLLYGPYFDAQVDQITIKKNIYHKTKTNYEFSGTMPEYHYEKSRSTILPRMYSSDADHIEAYRLWNGMKENQLPTFSDNLYFMLTYQMGHMYFRYIMFNFAGRQSDHQNQAWLSPIESIQSPGNIKYQNKARNQYWMIPLVIGIAGFIFQAKKDLRGFVMVLTLFLITGLILALYLNSPPIEPRERDYIYIGSFIAFCIWIGLGFITVTQFCLTKSWLRYSGSVAALGIPLLMLFQNFDDHDRSGRTLQVDSARNLLASCAENSIMFTGGDNDTFPLWYLQEVEGFRTDVRVMVLSYLNTDWYINQLRKKYYNSDAFKLTLSQQDYLQYGPNDVLYIQETIRGGVDLQKFLTLLKQPNSPLLAVSSTGDPYSILPSKTLRLDISNAALFNAKNNFSKISYADTRQQANTKFEIRVKGNYLQKNGLAILDLIASNDWKRPIYFNYTSLNTAGLDVESHVIQEGNLYRLIPQNTGTSGVESIPIDKELMYTNLINADYSNMLNKKVYLNYEDYQARIVNPVRQSFNSLAYAYLVDGNSEKATSVLKHALKYLYAEHLQPGYTNLQAAEMLASLNQQQEAVGLCRSLFEFSYETVAADQSVGDAADRLSTYLLKNSAELLAKFGDEKYLKMVKSLGY